jgi:hypothetical protein
MKGSPCEVTRLRTELRRPMRSISSLGPNHEAVCHCCNGRQTTQRFDPKPSASSAVMEQHLPRRLRGVNASSGANRIKDANIRSRHRFWERHDMPCIGSMADRRNRGRPPGHVRQNMRHGKSYIRGRRCSGSLSLRRHQPAPPRPSHRSYRDPNSRGLPLVPVQPQGSRLARRQ